VLVGTSKGLFFILGGFEQLNAYVDGRDARDDLDAPLARDAEVTVVAAVASGYLTVVGMFLIFPLMICCLIAFTFAARPAGAFGENFPRPTPFLSRP